MNSIIPPRIRALVEARQLIERDVRNRYEEERKSAGLWRRLAIEMKIQQEVAAELKRKFPPHALYMQRIAP